MRYVRDRDTKQLEVVLQPGEYYAGTGDMQITTAVDVLVTLCLCDKEAGVAGMQHLAASETLGRFGAPTTDSGLYGTHSTALFIKAIERKGGSRERLEASIYGGAHPGGGILGHEAVIAESCVSQSLKFLARLGVPLVARDLGGKRRRVVTLNVESGLVLVELSSSIAWLDPRRPASRLPSDRYVMRAA